MSDLIATTSEYLEVRSTSWVYLICVVIISAVLCLDMLIPLGVAIGVLYVCAILVSLWLPQKIPTLILAVICSVLVFGLYIYKLPVENEWKAVFNRTISIFVIWATSLLGVKLKEMHRERVHMEQHDTLTGLSNRALFSSLLQHSISLAVRYGNRMALLYADLDHFKPVNDTHGHAVGDILLMEVAQRMRSSVRSSDILGRIGGDEFEILLPKLESAAIALQVAEKVRQALAQPFEIAGNAIRISCSIGVAIYPDHGANEKELANHADQAMYGAKLRGRNSVFVFDDKIEANIPG